MFLILLAGCDTLNFYNQAFWGQMRLLHDREDVVRLIERPSTDPGLRARLEVAREIRRFAETELGLEVGERYSSYVELGRPFVVWNVFAAPPLAMTPEEWCFLVVGCVPYRGYFSLEGARRAAGRLAAAGLETYVGGVPAYSTLGWFNDPLLSSFIAWPDVELANLLLHELAHSRVWVDGDVRFNENFASFVGEAGAAQWARQTARRGEYRQWRVKQAGWQRMKTLLLAAKTYLAEGLEARAGTPAAAAFKRDAMAALAECYRAHRAELGGGRYDRLMQRVNNAYLVSLGTYEDLLPAFRELFRQSRAAWPEFFAAVAALAVQEREVRDARLTVLAEAAPPGSSGLPEEEIGDGADDHHAGEVQCHPFANHGLDGQPPG